MDTVRFAEVLDETLNKCVETLNKCVETLNKCVETLNKCVETLGTKANEYATEDRLHNFKIAAEMQNCTPFTALAGMMAKHTVSVYDLIQKVENGLVVTEDIWDEKIGDHINYLILLKALVAEQFDRYKELDDGR